MRPTGQPDRLGRKLKDTRERWTEFPHPKIAVEKKRSRLSLEAKKDW